MRHPTQNENQNQIALYDALAFVRPLAWAIAEDEGEPKWRRDRAQEAIGKIDAAMVAADSY